MTRTTGQSSSPLANTAPQTASDSGRSRSVNYPGHPSVPLRGITRDFTVAVFVVRHGTVLLHWHRKLSRWLPPGGHIEPNELPDEAAHREVLEETGVPIELRGPHGLSLDDNQDLPRQLITPAGIQLEDIAAGHQHIDLVYFAVPDDSYDVEAALPDQVGWYGSGEWAALNLTTEIIAWCERAVDET